MGEPKLPRGRSAYSPSSIPLWLNLANPTISFGSHSGFLQLTKRARLRGLNLQVPCSWQFWCGCGEIGRGYWEGASSGHSSQGQPRPSILRHKRSWGWKTALPGVGAGMTSCWTCCWDWNCSSGVRGLTSVAGRMEQGFCTHSPARSPQVPHQAVPPVLPQTFTLVVIVV